MARLVLANSAEACRDARVFVVNYVRSSLWAGSVDDATLVIHELVVNAFRHAQSEAVVECRMADSILHLGVHDRDPAPPHLVNDPGECGGYGLRLVAAVSEDWGYETGPTGKEVWAHLR
jgi:anti-sigma regulatory factor (Ser/Thr protein kinase)